MSTLDPKALAFVARRIPPVKVTVPAQPVLLALMTKVPLSFLPRLLPAAPRVKAEFKVNVDPATTSIALLA